MSDLLQQYTDVEKLKALIERKQRSPWEKPWQEITAAIKSRVRGQDHVADDVAKLISLQSAKISRRRPVANLLFVGPTGTGKTEMCKALSECLCDHEKNCLQYDCSQFKDQSGISRLVGSPQGYQGGTGELTTAMIANKRRIIVFDEIEKAHQSLADLFLSMMGDGRLADQRTGKEADFTESIIVLTSNAEQDKLTQMQKQITDVEELNNALRVQLRESGTFRPEIIGRIDRIYVFKELEGIVRAELVVMKIQKLCKEYGLELAKVSPDIICEAIEKGDKLKDFGARQREQVVEQMLGEALKTARDHGAKTVSLSIDEDGDLVVEPA